jgi:hypothetical protein
MSARIARAGMWGTRIERTGSMIRMLRKMSPAGDDTIAAAWNPDTVSPAELEKIEREFNRLTKQGYWAADITDGRDALTRKFDPRADTLMIPRVCGG